MVLEALGWSETENEKPPLPQLKQFTVHHYAPISAVEDLVGVFLDRQEYRREKGEIQDFRIWLSAKENQLLFDEALRKRQRA